MILLVCTYVVDVVLVVVVWAFETSGAMAKPTTASKAPRQKEVFIVILQTYRRCGVVRTLSLQIKTVC
jgi:hypothetical protein